MNVVITGSSGLIGSALMPRLSRNGHTIRRLVRGARAEGAARWNPDDGWLDESPLAGADAVVHLAGETIATGRWTAARKARIRDSVSGARGFSPAHWSSSIANRGCLSLRRRSAST